MTLKNSFFPSCLVLFLSVSFFSCKRNSTGDFFRNSICAQEKEKVVITADKNALAFINVRSTDQKALNRTVSPWRHISTI